MNCPTKYSQNGAETTRLPYERDVKGHHEPLRRIEVAQF